MSDGSSDGARESPMMASQEGARGRGGGGEGRFDGQRERRVKIRRKLRVYSLADNNDRYDGNSGKQTAKPGFRRRVSLVEYCDSENAG